MNDQFDVVFSVQSNGECPDCKNFKKCIILKSIKTALDQTERPFVTDVMEMVIYRCPKFDAIR